MTKCASDFSSLHSRETLNRQLISFNPPARPVNRPWNIRISINPPALDRPWKLRISINPPALDRFTIRQFSVYFFTEATPNHASALNSGWFSKSALVPRMNQRAVFFLVAPSPFSKFTAWLLFTTANPTIHAFPLRSVSSLNPFKPCFIHNPLVRSDEGLLRSKRHQLHQLVKDAAFLE